MTFPSAADRKSRGSAATFVNEDLASPQGLASDASGHLCAANNDNNTISKFNSAGTFQATIGFSTNLGAAYGLAFDSSSKLYAANFDNFTISKFDSSGNFVL